MATFHVQVPSALPAPEAWRRVLDLRRHDRLIPLTRITSGMVAADELGPGSCFVARTGLGPLGFDDRMVVDEITPPGDQEAGLARIRKEGRVVRGSIELRVTPLGAGSVVDWRQEIEVWGVPRALGWFTARAGRAAYGLALRRFLAHG
ncbi:SRPBCC family protein [Intrasporangium sp.]|uniref:SRPBCC family protein n=1 Tax=Intrasporangium sp. TaxID=1925024 RepID=UPI002939ACF8|nr:hypothetical protein [Intrasporangium sp.]MDV3222157.1 hypothetical protein [Intrasporangium sp.]